MPTARAEGLNEKVAAITAKAGDEGKLFGSVGTRYREAAEAAGLTLIRVKLSLPRSECAQLVSTPGSQVHAEVFAPSQRDYRTMASFSTNEFKSEIGADRR